MAQDRKKSYSDQKITERYFDIGDMVFLKIIHKKSSLSLGKFRKLKPRYCGPYTIIDKINDQAYQLLLLEHLKVHNVFHVNLLKKYFSRPKPYFWRWSTASDERRSNQHPIRGNTSNTSENLTKPNDEWISNKVDGLPWGQCNPGKRGNLTQRIPRIYGEMRASWFL